MLHCWVPFAVAWVLLVGIVGGIGNEQSARPHSHYSIEPDLRNQRYLQEFPALLEVHHDPSESFDLVPDLRKEQNQFKKQNEFVMLHPEDFVPARATHPAITRVAGVEAVPHMLEGMYGCVGGVMERSHRQQQEKHKKKQQQRGSGNGNGASAKNKTAVAQITKKLGQFSFTSVDLNEDNGSIVTNFDSVTDSGLIGESRTAGLNVPLTSASHFFSSNSLASERNAAQPISKCLYEQADSMLTSDSAHDKTVGSYLLVNSQNSNHLFSLSNALHFSNSGTTISEPDNIPKGKSGQLRNKFI